MDFIECHTGITGKALSDTILGKLSSYDLALELMRSQCYDGAGNMAGKNLGAATLITKQYKLALYLHCAAHCLNLAVVSGLQNTHVCNMMGVVWHAGTFFDAHPKRSNKKLPLFDENRVEVIKETGFTHTRYCPTKDNPADLLTRGITYQELQDSGLWTHGPAWLPQGDWPVCQILTVMDADSITDEQTCIELTTPVTNTGVHTVINGPPYNYLAKLN